MTKPLSPHLAALPLSPAQHIHDESQIILLEKFVSNSGKSKVLEKESLLDEYTDTYLNWISSTKNNTVLGLDLFREKSYSLGTSESFDKFYIENSSRKFKCFQGEYLYHKISWKSAGIEWNYIDCEENKIILEPNDAVVVSFPFADTGNRHPLMTEEFFDECLRLNIPVMLDCAYFGICQGMNFDFTHPAITDAVFSLSKSFPVRHFRIGLRLAKRIKDDGLTAYNNTQYLNKIACGIAIEFMTNFSPDYSYDTYRQTQLKFCEQFDLEPSNTVIFGIDTKSQYQKYNRGYPLSNRICFSKYLKLGEIPNNII
jgi:hypothetical protein